MTKLETVCVGHWRGRTLQIEHRPGRRVRWLLRWDSAGNHQKPAALHGWLREQWPALVRFYFTMELSGHLHLFIAAARLIHACGETARAIEWLAEVELLPTERRLAFVEMAIPFAQKMRPTTLLRELPAASVTEYRDTLRQALSALERGVAPAFIEQSLHFAHLVSIHLPFDQARPGSIFDAWSAIAALEQAGIMGKYNAGQLWQLFAKRPEAAQWLTQEWWLNIGFESADDWLQFVVRESEKACCWPHLRAKLETIRDCFLTLTPEQRATTAEFRDWWFLRLPKALPALQRFTRNNGLNLHLLARLFLRLPPAERDAFLAAPDSSCEALAKALRWRNDCQLVEKGLLTLFARTARHAVAVFRNAPKHLFHLARYIGAFPKEQAVEIIRPLAATPLWNAAIADGDVVALDNLLLNHRDLAQRLARFREWDLHFSGRKLMPPAGVALAFNELRQQLSLLAVWQLEEAVRRRMQVDPHTYAMVRESKPHRRPLQRLLREPAIDYVDRHPATRAWLRRHPGFDLRRWRAGIPFTRDGVRLELERDPVEILKMGSYVGSCLALGGMNSFNPASVLLDVNKQVVFARDAQGKFLARQILAISDRRKLVCYTVYAVGDREKWEPLFAEYARAFAWALGVPIHIGDQHKVETVVARKWYDDGAWDLLSDEERVAA